MLDIILKILSVLGILLLALLALVLLALLLVLFLPVTYRIRGRMGTNSGAEESGTVGAVRRGGLELTAGMNWLFGFLRVRYAYPAPGILTVKLLWFKLLRAKPAAGGEGAGKEDGKPRQNKKERDTAKKREEEKAGGQEDGLETREQSGPGETKSRIEEESGSPEDENTEEKGLREGETGEEAAESGGFLKKFQKIKYTMRSVYDKMKKIWQNISYYTALLREDDTIRLFGQIKMKLFKILKNIRPRHIRADILFGTGAPDSTGRLYGVYSMFYPVLGKGCLVTPDFERKVLEGNFAVSGHITVFVLLTNILVLALDRRLRLFIRKIKREEIKNDK